jgi:phage FluMu gp28-like protein
MPPKIEYTRPHMTDYQREIMDCPERFACIEASTKAGKTACMIVWLLEQALLCGPNQSVYWVAPVFAQARIAFERMKSQINDRNFFKVNETRLTLTLPHGSVIEFKSGDNPDTLYGNDCYAAVLDEASRMREASWVAIRSTLTATNGKCKLIGNVRGRKNFFYKMAMRAKGGEPGYFYKKITAYDAVKAGILKLEEIESAKRDLPESVFNELYLAEASEDGSNPFGIKYIAMCCQPTLSTQPSVCYGIDLARKVDAVSIIGLDKLGTMSHYHNFSKVGWQQTIDTVRYLPSVPMAMDSTGVGDVVLSQVELVQTQVEGYIFTQASKQRLMEGLAVAIQSRKIIIADDGDVVNGTGKLRHQLEQFEIEYTRTGVTYSAPEGEHDDDVCALALAWHKWGTAAQTGNISVW